jgi:endo-1,4-beta-xylanase
MKNQIFFAIVGLCILSCKKSAQQPADVVDELLSQKAVVVMNTPYSPDNPILKNANTDFEIGAAINEGKFGNSLYTGLARQPSTIALQQRTK